MIPGVSHVTSRPAPAAAVVQPAGLAGLVRPGLRTAGGPDRPALLALDTAAGCRCDGLRCPGLPGAVSLPGGARPAAPAAPRPGTAPPNMAGCRGGALGGPGSQPAGTGYRGLRSLPFPSLGFRPGARPGGGHRDLRLLTPDLVAGADSDPGAAGAAGASRAAPVALEGDGAARGGAFRRGVRPAASGTWLARLVRRQLRQSHH